MRHKLDGIANEMQSTLLRSSFSPIVKEGLDASASLFTPDGTTLAQSCSIPIHLATLIPAVAAVLQAYPTATMRDGDAFILNDPYAGGTHLPDIAVIMPVCHHGRVIALSAAMTHHQDVGGMSAGSVPTNATEIFQEGLRIPPLKLRDAGVLNETLLALLRRNVRIPDTVIGDLNAQIAACTVGVRRVSELAERYGDNQLASDRRGTAAAVGTDDAAGAARRSRRGPIASSIFSTMTGSNWTGRSASRSRSPCATARSRSISPAPARRCAARSTACRRGRWRRRAGRCGH